MMNTYQKQLLDNSRKVYFNKKDETHLHLKDIEYFEKSQLKFWTFNSYHRVFGLYVHRCSLVDSKNSNQYSNDLTVYKIITQNDITGRFVYHHYALYWPSRSYVSNIFNEYLDATNHRQRTTYAIRQQLSWYQSITSMMIMGTKIGNPDRTDELDELANGAYRPISLASIYNAKSPSMNKYFWLSASRQLGQHVFINSNGTLSTIQLRVIKLIDNKCFIDMFPSSRIHAQYPTIRNERHTGFVPDNVLDRQVFTMGLIYERFGPNGESCCWFENHGTGTNREQLQLKPMNNWQIDGNYRKVIVVDDRVYTRFLNETQPISVGGVSDLTERLYRHYCYDDQRQQSSDQRWGGKPEANTWYALYMCAGAKLIVRDSYQENPESERHNHALVEQGGVVVVEDQLEVSLGIYSDVDHKPVIMNWEELCEKYIKTNDFIKEKVKKYKNPVLFLGANESDYNTIAWRLLIDKRGYESTTINNVLKWQRRCCLQIPEGAYIVAVEEWEPGVEEIWRRHQYEQLHRAIVRHSQDNPYFYRGYEPQRFAAPNDPLLLAKIITNQDQDNENNTYVDRNIEIDIQRSAEINEAYDRYYYKRKEDRNLVYPNKVYPKEFNFYRFNTDDKQQNYRRCPPPTPPAYPPVKISDPDNPNHYQIFYLPQILTIDDKNKCDLRAVFKKYSYDPLTYKTMCDQNIYPFGKQQDLPRLQLSDDKSFIYNEYEWRPMKNPFIYKHISENREDYRLGVDGQYYRKIGNRIGSVNSLYYEFVYPSYPNKTVNILPKVVQNSYDLVVQKTDDDIKRLIQNSELMYEPF